MILEYTYTAVYIDEFDLFIIVVEEVMKKVKCIRSQYSREKHKDRVRRNRSVGVDDVYNSRWLHFDSLSFLDDYLIAKRNVPNSMVG